MKKLLSLLLFAGLAMGLTSCTEDPPVDEGTITLDETTITLYYYGDPIKDEFITLTAETTPDTHATVHWSSSKPEVASVDNTGKVTAKNIGIATIHAATDSGAHTTCLVTVETPPVTVQGITLTQKDLSLDPGETSNELEYTLTPAGSKAIVSWSTSNPVVATVENGVVKGLFPGTATITASVLNGVFEDTCVVTVNNADFEVGRGVCGPTLEWLFYNYADGRRVLTISGGGRMTEFTYGKGDLATSAPWYDWMGTITEVVLPSGLTSIGSHAFDMPEDGSRNPITALTTINMPTGVKSIGNYAFRNCSLMALDASTLPALDILGGYAFFRCAEMFGQANLSSGLSILNPGIFYGCAKLTGKITIPSSVRGELGYSLVISNPQEYGLFQGCVGLTEVDFTGANQVTNIFLNAFNGCTGLTKVTLSEGLQRISRGAFYDCTALTEITIPASVNFISWFTGCTNLKKVTILGARPLFKEDGTTPQTDRFGTNDAESPLTLATYSAYYPVVIGQDETTGESKVTYKTDYAFPAFDTYQNAEDPSQDHVAGSNNGGKTVLVGKNDDTTIGNTLYVPATSRMVTVAVKNPTTGAMENKELELRLVDEYRGIDLAKRYWGQIADVPGETPAEKAARQNPANWIDWNFLQNRYYWVNTFNNIMEIQ